MNYGQRFMTLYCRQGSRPSPWKRKCKKAKWLSEEDLQIPVKRIEVKSKGEKERYTHLNAEFQRRARRDKKAFLSRHEFDSWVGKIPWRRKCKPLQYSYLGNPMDRGAWWATVHGAERARHD